MSVMRKLIGSLRPYNGIKTATILQLSATECGVISLAILFAYFGVNVSVDVLREHCGTSRDGAKAATLINVAEKFKFSAAAYRVELDDIRKLTQPVIAFWKFNHYIVIEGVGVDKVYINDPASGRTTVSFDEFDRAFTGIIISIDPNEDITLLKKRHQFLPMLNEWVSRYRYDLTFVIGCMVLAASVPLLNAKLSSLFIDYAVIGRNDNMIPGVFFATLAAGLVLTLTMSRQRLAQFRLTTKASIIKSSEIMQHMLKLPLLFYSLRQKTDISAILMRSEVVANMIFKSMAVLLMNSVTILLSLFCLIKIDSVLVFALLVLALVLLTGITILSRFNYHYEQSNMHALGKFYGLTLSAIKNIETIKTCDIEHSTFTKWYSAFCAKIQAQDKTNVVTILMDCLYQSFSSLSMLVTFYLGIARVAEGRLSVGELMAFYSLQMYFCGQLISILNAGKDTQSSLASHSRINDILQYKIDERFLPRLVEEGCSSEAALSCHDITFFYNKAEQPTLTNITLEILAGQHIALVGGTGSGKSTLVKILCHLQPASSGNIWLHGRRIETYSAHELTKEFAYVSQDVSLFAGTIYENLTMWHEGIDPSVIQSAIEDACLGELIEARGLHGCVEESGNNFSGGERQRIDIARALIQGASLLALDEATSALDVETENRLLQNLRRRNITIIFVAHRLSTIKHCDQILVMEKGCIVERGSHAQLLAQLTHYQQLLLSESLD